MPYIRTEEYRKERSIFFKNLWKDKDYREKMKKNKQEYFALNKHPFKCKGKKHPSYKNGSGRGYQYRYVKMSIELLGKSCQICNTSKDVYTHHKDENPRNNPLDGSNWQRLCRSCHGKLHWEPKRKFKTPEEGVKFRYRIKATQRKIEKERLIRRKLGTKRYLTANDLCKILNISRERIRQLRKAGHFYYVKIGGNYYYPPKYRKETA